MRAITASFASKSRIHKILFTCFLLGILLPQCLCNCSLAEHADDLKIKQHELQLLARIKPLYGKKFKDDDGKYDYHVTICGKVDGLTTNAGAVQVEGDTKRSLGQFDRADIMGGSNWILLTYFNGSNYQGHCNASERTTQIMIICDEDREIGNFNLLMEKRKIVTSHCSYWFELGSSLACTKKVGSSGMSSGGIFCIIFFTFAAVYLVMGFLYKRLVVGSKGIEQIPNYTFWRAFGNLQADACDFICRCGPRHENQAYRGIDDRLKAEEHDDQLLNM